MRKMILDESRLFARREYKSHHADSAVSGGRALRRLVHSSSPRRILYTDGSSPGIEGMMAVSVRRKRSATCLSVLSAFMADPSMNKVSSLSSIRDCTSTRIVMRAALGDGDRSLKSYSVAG